MRAARNPFKARDPRYLQLQCDPDAKVHSTSKNERRQKKLQQRQERDAMPAVS